MPFVDSPLLSPYLVNFSICCWRKKDGCVPDQSFLHAVSSMRTTALWWLVCKAASLDLYHREIGSHPIPPLHWRSYILSTTPVWCSYVWPHWCGALMYGCTTPVWCSYGRITATNSHMMKVSSGSQRRWSTLARLLLAQPTCQQAPPEDVNSCMKSSPQNGMNAKFFNSLNNILH